MRVIFLDTNVLIQCRKLEEIPWQEISADENISLLISRPVQEEIDNMKQDGNSRRAKRSRTATSFMREIMASDSLKLIIRKSNPLVEIGFAPPVFLKDPPFSFLNLSSFDDRIIAEAISFKKEHPEDKVHLLTHDTQPMLTSKHCGLDVIAVPETWLLPAEPDDRDKKIAALEEKIHKLELQYPSIKITSKDPSQKPISTATLQVHRYIAPSDKEIEAFVQRIVNKNPIVTNFSAPPAPKLFNSTSTINIYQHRGFAQRYEPPTEAEIRKLSMVIEKGTISGH